MVAQLLAHIDTLDAALQKLTELIEFVPAPHAQVIELLRTIPGVQEHAAQVLIAECGLDMSLFPHGRAFAYCAGAAQATTNQPAAGARAAAAPAQVGSPLS